MAFHILLGNSSSGIRNDNGEILGSIDWSEKFRAYIILLPSVPKLDQAQAASISELDYVFKRAIGEAPVVRVGNPDFVDRGAINQERHRDHVGRDD